MSIKIITNSDIDALEKLVVESDSLKATNQVLTAIVSDHVINEEKERYLKSLEEDDGRLSGAEQRKLNAELEQILADDNDNSVFNNGEDYV
jgi:hypothetical protein